MQFRGIWARVIRKFTMSRMFKGAWDFDRQRYWTMSGRVGKGIPGGGSNTQNSWEVGKPRASLGNRQKWHL